MKVLVVAVNSKFTHTSLSARTLCLNTQGADFFECTINESLWDIVSGIFAYKPQAVCFCSYIWNIDYVLKISSVIKKMMPQVIVVLGGPEVTYCAENVLAQNEFVDAVIRGEGEIIFDELVKNNFDFKDVNGVTYRNKEIISNPDHLPILNLDILTFPYTSHDLEVNKGKLIYYESSRGCPYNCSYCLSSAEKGIRYKSIQKAEEELAVLISHKPYTIKFVDRTFNADSERAIELIRFMKENGAGITFHFEIEAHTLNDEFFELIKDAPEGMFRFEIGLQSTNRETLIAINRNPETDKLTANIKRLTELNNVHVHLDLISGLPYENLECFKKSFDDALNMDADVLQLGFLKLLKGTKIRNQAREMEYKYTDFSPYEIISNKWITPEDILHLKRVEEMVDKYYNSQGFKNSLQYLKDILGSWWNVFDMLQNYYLNNKLFIIKHSKESLYDIMADFGRYINIHEAFLDILKYDYLTSNKNAATPKWSLDKYNEQIHKQRCEIIELNLNDCLRDYSAVKMRDLLKLLHFEVFSYEKDGTRYAHKVVRLFDKKGKYIGVAKLPEDLMLC